MHWDLVGLKSTRHDWSLTGVVRITFKSSFPSFFETAPLDFFLLASGSRLLSDSLQGPTLCRRRLSITSLQVTLKSTNSFVNLRQLASVQSRCFIIQSFLLQCYFMSYCVVVCLQVGKMAVHCHASFFRAGKSRQGFCRRVQRGFLKVSVPDSSKRSRICCTLEWRKQNFNW